MGNFSAAGSGYSQMLLLALPLLFGFFYGYISSKGQFCMNSGFSNVFRNKDSTKLKSFVAAILIQMLVLPLGFAWLHLNFPDHSILAPIGLPPLFLIANVVGGFLFGIFMYYSGGCGAGIFYKIGERNSGALLAATGFILGIFLTEKWFLAAASAAAQQAIVIEQRPIWEADSALLLTAAVALFAAIALTLLYRLDDKKPKGAEWGWRKTGGLIGLVGVLTWGAALLSQSPFGMAIIPGVMDFVSFSYSWAFLFVIGIPLGAFWSSRKTKAKQFTLPTARIIGRRLLGGLGLGISGSLAAGCTVGHGLTFFPLLGIGSIVATVFIFLGSGLVGWLTRK